jgi:hypothetical protein
VRAYEGRVQFVGFGGGDTADHIDDFVSYYSLRPVPTVIDEDWSIREGLGIIGAPAWVFLNDGGDATLHLGGLNPRELEEMLQVLVAG